MILLKQFIMDQNKTLNWNETKHHLNTNQLLCVFAHFAVIWVFILNGKKKKKNNTLPVLFLKEIL